MVRRFLIVLHAASVLLAPAVARAQGAEGPRFRGAIGLEIGPILASGSLGEIGVQGQLGAQIDANWAVFAVPSFGVAYGAGVSGAAGVAGTAVLAEYTSDHFPFAVGAGVDGSVVFGDVPRAWLYGGRLRGTWYPFARGGGRHTGDFFIALDMRLLGLTFYLPEPTSGTMPCPSPCPETTTGPSFAFSPVASFGYRVF